MMNSEVGMRKWEKKKLRRLEGEKVRLEVGKNEGGSENDLNWEVGRRKWEK